MSKLNKKLDSVDAIDTKKALELSKRQQIITDLHNVNIRLDIARHGVYDLLVVLQHTPNVMNVNTSALVSNVAKIEQELNAIVSSLDLKFNKLKVGNEKNKKKQKKL